MQICEAFAALVDLAIAAGSGPLNQLPGCWEYQIDDRWWVAMNGHQEPMRNSDNFEVPPFECVVKYNGWPAGVFGPGGGIVAAGECANETTFIEAMRSATAKLAHN